MDITTVEYKNNLLFYTILKNLIKCHLSENKMILFQQLIEENKNLEYSKLIEFLGQNVVNEKVRAYDDYSTLLNLCNSENCEMWSDLTSLSIDLLLSKNLILEEAKSYAKIQYDDGLATHKDKLSFGYDMVNLEYPYGQRVISALLVYTLTNVDRDTEFILETSGKTVKKLNEKIRYVTKKYNINANNIFMIVMDESINQSITSTAGSSYESRVNSVLLNISDNVRTHAHDKFINSVEYDYTFELDGKTYGVSAKRTLRERYKQNFEDVNQLSVDAMFLVTLGIDLNEEKLNNIMQRHGYYVIIAQEVYDSKQYFQKNGRVISSKNLDAEKLRKLFKKFVRSEERRVGKECRG